MEDLRVAQRERLRTKKRRFRRVVKRLPDETRVVANDGSTVLDSRGIDLPIFET
jgi:hypothetical protein